RAVDAPLAPVRRFPAEMLHRIRHPYQVLGEPGLRHATPQHQARRPDERVAPAVLGVAGLLADEHDGRAGGPLAEDCLGGVAPPGQNGLRPGACRACRACRCCGRVGWTVGAKAGSAKGTRQASTGRATWLQSARWAAPAWRSPGSASAPGPSAAVSGASGGGARRTPTP